MAVWYNNKAGIFHKRYRVDEIYWVESNQCFKESYTKLNELEKCVKEADETVTLHWGHPERNLDIEYEVLELIKIAREAGVDEIA